VEERVALKIKFKCPAIVCCLLGAIFRLNAQGYIVPNGVTSGGYAPGAGYEINVLHDPVNLHDTGFFLNPVSANTFQFDPIVDVGVRVFLVSANDPISLPPILSLNYPELTHPNDYVFANATPFYVALFTGNQSFAPPNRVYSDPLFGWAELENVGGAIQLINGALEYQGGGIFAGTQNIIPAPEPGTLALAGAGAVLMGLRQWRKR
jgi:hypothetical protein